MRILNSFCKPKPLFSRLQMTVAIAFTLIGFILHIWFVSKAFLLLRTVSFTTIRFEEIRHQMQTFMAFRGLSSAVQKRILTFYDFSFNGNYFRRQEISELLGNELRSQVTIETCKHLLAKNFIFKQIPDELLSSIANCLTEAVYLENDVIGKVESARTQVNAMTKVYISRLKFVFWFRKQKLHFIVSGTVAVYNEEGDELAHLHDGNMFGEVAFLLSETDYVSQRIMRMKYENIMITLLVRIYSAVLELRCHWRNRSACSCPLRIHENSGRDSRRIERDASWIEGEIFADGSDDQRGTDWKS